MFAERMCSRAKLPLCGEVFFLFYPHVRGDLPMVLYRVCVWFVFTKLSVFAFLLLFFFFFFCRGNGGRGRFDVAKQKCLDGKRRNTTPSLSAVPPPLPGAVTLSGGADVLAVHGHDQALRTRPFAAPDGRGRACGGRGDHGAATPRRAPPGKDQIIRSEGAHPNCTLSRGSVGYQNCPQNTPGSGM